MPSVKLSSSTDNHQHHLHYQEAGSGKPVILIHGWPLTSIMWEYQIDHLVQNGFRVITYDRRGFGESCRPWGNYDYDTLTSDLNELITALNLSDVALVGFSMGGGEVVRYFSKFGGKGVTKAVLISSITPYMLKTPDNPDGVPQEMFDKMLAAMKEDRIAFLDDFGKTFFGVTLLNNNISDQSLNYYLNVCSQASPHATIECAKSFSSTDFRSEMSSVNVPTLIIHGDKDETVPIKPTALEATKVIKNNKLIVYEGEPHGIWFTQKERLSKDLVTFLMS